MDELVQLEERARTETVCRGCNGEKGTGLIVCWPCFKYREDIVDGLEKAPASFLGLLQGKNFGKMLVRMAP